MYKLFFLSCVLTTVVNVANAGDEKAVLQEFKYLAKDNALEVVLQKQQQAKKSGKLLLLAMGAEWCHDSRGLGAKFSNPEVTDKLKAKYEIEFVDVGYLNKGFDIAEHYGHNIYWGTPSVLIIDPNTSKVINRDSVWHWTNADSIKLTEYKEYFLDTELKAEASFAGNTQYQTYLKQIKQFESVQNAKLKAAYKIVGPLLKQYKDSGNKPTDEFNNAWNEVRAYRVAVSEDLNKLYQTARDNTQNKSKADLTFPTYEKFSWE